MRSQCVAKVGVGKLGREHGSRDRDIAATLSLGADLFGESRHNRVNLADGQVQLRENALGILSIDIDRCDRLARNLLLDELLECVGVALAYLGFGNALLESVKPLLLGLRLPSTSSVVCKSSTRADCSKQY